MNFFETAFVAFLKKKSKADYTVREVYDREISLALFLGYLLYKFFDD